MFKRLFGKREKASQEKASRKKAYVDEKGIYVTVECGRCQNHQRVRIDRQNDLNLHEDGYRWRKTIVCDSCFQQMPTEIVFDSKRQKIVGREIEKGRYLEEN